jgi:hypothetical protein
MHAACSCRADRLAALIDEVVSHGNAAGEGDHGNFGVFGGRRPCLRRGALNCSPYCRTIATASCRRMPTAPRSSTKVHSAAMRLTTSSGVNIGAIGHHPETNPGVVLNLYRQRACNSCGVIPEIDMWRVANLMLKRYGDNAEAESARRADELAAGGDHVGVAVWHRIIDAIGQLANTTPPGPVH